MNEAARKHIKGYFYLLITIILYVITPFFVKELYINRSMSYNKPFFIGYFCSVLYVLYGIPMFIQKMGQAGKQPKEALAVATLDSNPKALTDRRILTIALILGVVTLTNSYFFNLGVDYTSVVSNFIIHDTSDVFVFVGCMVLLKWKFSWVRMGAVLASVIGVLFIAYSDSKDKHQTSPLLGDMFSICSTVTYALIIILTKMYIEDEESMDWSKYFYYMGVTTAVIWLPVLLLLHVTGIEPFELPNQPAFILLMANGIFGYVLPDYSLSISTVLLDPLVVDLGLGVLTPISMIIDYYYENKTLDAMYLSGYGFILGSFVAVVIYDFMHEIPKESQGLKEKQEDMKSEELMEKV